jgi:hypothetical protein
VRKWKKAGPDKECDSLPSLKLGLRKPVITEPGKKRVQTKAGHVSNYLMHKASAHEKLPREFVQLRASLSLSLSLSLSK